MYSLVTCFSHLTTDHASLSRRSTVPTPNRDTSNVWALVTFFSIYYTKTVCLSAIADKAVWEKITKEREENGIT